MLWLLAEQLALEPVEWCKLIVVGAWKGHNAGPFEVKEAHLEEAIANFNRDPKRRIVVDFNHASLRPGPAPAAGWVVALERREEAGKPYIAAKIEWLAETEAAIRRGEYRYLSPTLFFDSRDKVTGNVVGLKLHSVALTNTPFLDELGPIALQEFPLTLKQVLGLAETATDQEVQAAVVALQSQVKAKDVAATEAMAEAAKLKALNDKLGADSELLAFVLSETGITAKSPVDAKAALTPVLKHAGFVPASEVTALREQLAAQQVERLVAQAETEGKVTPATLEWFKGFALKDVDGAKAWLAAAPASAPPAKEREGGGRKVKLTEQQMKVAKQLGLTDEAYAKQLEVR